MKRQLIITGTVILIAIITYLLADEVFLFCQNELGKSHEKAWALAIVMSLACPVFSVIPMRWELLKAVIIAGVIICQIYASTASIVAPKLRATLSSADENLVSELMAQADKWDPVKYRTKRTEILMQIAEIQGRKTAEPLQTTLPYQIIVVRLLLEILLICLANALKLYLETPVKKLDTQPQRVVAQDLTINDSAKALTYKQPELSQEAKYLYHWLGWKGGEATKTQMLQCYALGKGKNAEYYAPILAELTSAGVVNNGDGKYHLIEKGE